MAGRGLNRQVVLVAAVALVVLVVGSIILSSAGVDLFGTYEEDMAEEESASPNWLPVPLGTLDNVNVLCVRRAFELEEDVEVKLTPSSSSLSLAAIDADSYLATDHTLVIDGWLYVWGFHSELGQVSGWVPTESVDLMTLEVCPQPS